MKEAPLNSRMNRFLLLSLAAGLLSPIPAEAFWGLTKEESRICRQRASREKNEFSAKQTYEYCKRNIKKELKPKRDALNKKKKEQERKAREEAIKTSEKARKEEEENRLFRETHGEKCREYLERLRLTNSPEHLRTKPVDELTEDEKLKLHRYRIRQLQVENCRSAGAL